MLVEPTVNTAFAALKSPNFHQGRNNEGKTDQSAIGNRQSAIGIITPLLLGAIYIVDTFK
jgi:hypothetical protein